jgi:hypothetical protein
MFKSLETYMTEQELLRHFHAMASPHVYFEAVVGGQAQDEVDDTETDSYCDCGEDQDTDNEWEHANAS